MNFRPPVDDAAPVILGIVEHAGQRRDPEPLDGLARIERRVDVHDLRAAGGDQHAQRAGYVRRVHQRIQQQSAGIRGRTLEPERGEDREVLFLVERGIDRQRASRQSVLAGIPAHRTKIRSAKECRDIGLPIGHELHAKAGKP